MINLLSSNLYSPLKSKQMISQNKKAPVLPGYSCLKPLAKDTVSFTANTTKSKEEAYGHIRQDGRQKILNNYLIHAYDNKAACEEVSKNAKFATNYLQKLLMKNLSGFIETDDNPKGIIKAIEIRVKTPESIREKVAGTLGDCIVSENPTAFNPLKKEEIKAHCKDLIGARIVMSKDTKSDCAKVIDALIDDIEKGNLKITSIENYVQETNHKVESYFDPEDLNRLCKSVNKQRKENGLDAIEIEYKEKKTGYMALHLDISISSKNFKVKDTDYLGEIQIVGNNVSKFKELEDLCYKINSEKDVKSGDCAFLPFVKYFKYQMENKKYPNLKEDFRTYTKRTYILQKMKVKPSGDNEFPTIKDCKMEGRIPPGLDFNVLNEIKKNCDALYETSQTYAA